MHFFFFENQWEILVCTKNSKERTAKTWRDIYDGGKINNLSGDSNSTKHQQDVRMVMIETKLGKLFI